MIASAENARYHALFTEIQLKITYGYIRNGAELAKCFRECELLCFYYKCIKRNKDPEFKKSDPEIEVANFIVAHIRGETDNICADHCKPCKPCKNKTT